MSNRRRAQLRTNGYDWTVRWVATLYGDGSVALEWHSRWQNSTDGARWRTKPGAVGLEDGDDPEAVLQRWFDANEADIHLMRQAWAYGERTNWAHTYGVRMTRRGWRVR